MIEYSCMLKGHKVKEIVKELFGKKLIIFLLMDSFEIWMELMGIQLRTQKAG